MKKNLFELLDSAELHELEKLENESAAALPETISMDAIRGKVYRDAGLTPAKRKRGRILKICAITACLLIVITSILVFAPIQRFPETVHTPQQLKQQFDTNLIFREDHVGNPSPEGPGVGSLVGSKDDLYVQNGVPERGIIISGALGKALSSAGLTDYLAVYIRYENVPGRDYSEYPRTHHATVDLTKLSRYGYYIVENQGHHYMIVTAFDFMKLSFARESIFTEAELMDVVFHLASSEQLGI